MIRKGQVRWLRGATFGARFSSLKSCSRWLLKIPTRMPRLIRFLHILQSCNTALWIRSGLLSLEEADSAKEILEANRFKMAFSSFRDVV